IVLTVTEERGSEAARICARCLLCDKMGAVSAVAADIITTGQFEEMELPRTCEWELHNGTVCSVTFPGYNHTLVQRRLARLLEDLIINAPVAGLVFVELPYRTGDKNDHRADVAVITSCQHVNDVRNDRLEGSPKLVVEVLSRSNTSYRVEELQSICFEHGCEELWQVNLRTKSVHVLRADQEFGPERSYTVGDSIPIRILNVDAILAVDAIFTAE
ncbi:MAG TPA: Uma2 family endonuclease, partial [Bryobacteraceae bacterium]|nr:Uma2 family endonuclease [Bryobacteraceae bacterium]